MGALFHLDISGITILSTVEFNLKTVHVTMDGSSFDMPTLAVTLN